MSEGDTETPTAPGHSRDASKSQGFINRLTAILVALGGLLAALVVVLANIDKVEGWWKGHQHSASATQPVSQPQQSQGSDHETNQSTQEGSQGTLPELLANPRLLDRTVASWQVRVNGIALGDSEEMVRHELGPQAVVIGPAGVVYLVTYRVNDVDFLIGSTHRVEQIEIYDQNLLAQIGCHTLESSTNLWGPPMREESVPGVPNPRGEWVYWDSLGRFLLLHYKRSDGTYVPPPRTFALFLWDPRRTPPLMINRPDLTSVP